MADNNILNRLDGLKLKFEEIGQQMTDPEVIGDMKKFVQLNKEYKELKPIIERTVPHGGEQPARGEGHPRQRKG